MKIKQIAKEMKNVFTRHLFRQNDQIAYMEAREMMRENPSTILIDVRSKQEYDEYHLEGAICIPTYELTDEILKRVNNKEQTIIVYCQSGGRSRKAIGLLKKMGYQSLYEIKGGLDNL